MSGVGKSLKLKIPTGPAMNWYILFLFQLFPMIVPDGLSSISAGLHLLIYRYWQAVSFALIFVEFILLVKNSKGMIGFVAGIVGALFYVAIVSLVKGAGIASWYNNLSVVLFTVLLINNKRRHLDRALLAVLLLLEFWVYVNFVCMLLFPGGMYKSEATNSNLCWILGYKSSFQYYIIPALCLSWINMEYRNQRIRFYALMAVSVFSALTSRNMMLVAGLAIVILFYISKMYKATKIFCMRNYLIAGIVANLLYIFFTAVLIASDLGKALLAATGKSATLSGRASILIPYTLLQIKEAPIFGHGVLSNEVRVGMYGGGKALIHAHNQVLEIAFIGGAVLLVLFVLLHLAVNKKLMAKKQYPASQVLSLFIFVLLFMTLFEVYTRRTAAGIWCIIALSYYVRELHQCFCNRSDFSMRRQVPDRKYRR